MSDAYIGEIQAFGFYYDKGFKANSTWLPCNGQLIPIQQNTALFSLIGNYYGGDGRTNFALPNLNSGVVVGGIGNGPGLTPRTIGEQDGQATVTLTQQEMPAHNHPLSLGPPNVQTGASASPGSNGTSYLADPFFSGFATTPPNTNLAITAMYSKGGSQAHENMQPALAMAWYIAIDGIFPYFP